ncbi:MAG: hypothetical protein QOJ39_3096 [Candidatus Eremiobacteraeota bacterium]|nr:hypothetical protein [Candidatus Eremiobacteraeota bacterium]MEA2721232.1 hypothetical protein [Candidatus Eremiobacteraeota bacterium]
MTPANATATIVLETELRSRTNATATASATATGARRESPAMNSQMAAMLTRAPFSARGPSR